MLTNWQTDLVLDAEAQSSDATTRTIDLPRDGHISMIDLIFAMTNGATGNSGYSNGGTQGTSPWDVITKLEIIANGSKTILSVTSVEDLIAEAIRITGKVPARTMTEVLGEVQRIHVPIYFGRFIDDKLMVIPNGAYKGGNFFDSLQLKITYSMDISTNDFATGTFTVTCGIKKLVDNSPPETKLLKTFQHKEDYTTVGSATKSINLTYGQSLFMRSIQVYAYEVAIGEGVDITKLLVEYNSIGGGKLTPFEAPWKSIQKHNALTYGVGDLMFGGLGFLEDTDYINSRVPNVKHMNVDSALVALSTTAESVIRVEALAGDRLTVGSWLTTATGSDSAANASDIKMYWNVTTDVIPRYAYIDFDESKTMNDLLDTGGMTALVLKMTDGASGGAVRINEEFIMRAIDFRTS